VYCPDRFVMGGCHRWWWVGGSSERGFPAGPESIKLGIWAYAAVIVRQSGKSAKRIVVTAAA
jgi:hypothetical protein